MGLFNNDYDPGFLNVPGFGQSATNPLAPVFYDSLGVVKDLSVYSSVFASKSVEAGESVNVGNSRLSKDNFEVSVPVHFLEDVNLDRNLSVGGVTSTNRLIVDGREYRAVSIVGENGSFTVLAAV